MPKKKGLLATDEARIGYQEGAEVENIEEEILDQQPPIGMLEPTPEIITNDDDEQMEADYMDFIISESLNPEDEQYLLARLDQDDRLSTIFDRVFETASEFSGSGPVEGPGTQVSDSIPARLSDGEFVMTSKAANQIGPDNLQGMMEQAEFNADENERRIMQAGGKIEKEEKAVDQYGRPLPQEATAEEIKKSMLSINPRLQ